MLSREDQIRKEELIEKLRKFNEENELAVIYRKHLDKAEESLNRCEIRLDTLKYKLIAGIIMISGMLYIISLLSTTKDFINTVGLCIISVIMLVATFIVDKAQYSLAVNEAESHVLKCHEDLITLYKTTNKIIKYTYSDKDTVDSLIDILEKSDASTIDEAISIYNKEK